jgi:hypothetical protein
VDVLFYLRSAGQHILVSDTIMAVVLCIIKLCDVLTDVDVLFYIRSDGQHILVTDTIMAIFLLFLYCVTF